MPIEFSELVHDFSDVGTKIIGISKDSLEKPGKFRTKFDLKCYFSPHPRTKICEQFGVWIEKSVYTRKYMEVQRATFLVETGGTIVAVCKKVKLDGHAAEEP